MNKEPFSDDTLYSNSEQHWNPKGDRGPSYYPYHSPQLDKYSYKDYEANFALASQDPDFVWFPSQKQKLKESEFDQVKVSIKELENNKNPDQSPIYKKIQYLRSDMLLNAYQFFSYQTYLDACKLSLEQGGPDNENMIYNPPLDEKTYLIEKQKILKAMVAKDEVDPIYLYEKSKIFPN